MTSTPNEPRLYDVWLMWVEFPDHPGIGKPRPVVITEVDGDLVSGIVAKINQHLDGTLELSIVPLIVLPDNNKGVSIMDEETEVYTIYQRVTQIEKRHVTAPKGLTFNQLSDWVDENGVGDLLDIDELDNDMVSADYEDGSHVKRKWAN